MANRSKSPKSPTFKQEAANENTSQVRLEELARASTELARIVAKNSSAAPELLQELGSSSDDTTRKNVTSNPNTPTDILLKLGAQFPGQLLENPVFTLLFLENPNLLADMPLATLRSLLKRDAVPESFLEWAAGSTDEGVLLAVAMNPNTPKSALEKLIQNRNADVAEAAKLHVNWAGEMSEGWEEAALAAMEATRLPRDRQKETYLWAIGAIPEFLVPTLDREVRLSIAQNPNTPTHILEMLAGDSDHDSEAEDQDRRLSIIEIHVALAQNPNTPVSLLEQLAGDHSDQVCESVVYHPKTPLTLQQQFRLQLQVVEDPETPTDILRELATSQWVHIRLGVAGHPNTPRDTLEQLAGDKDSLIRTSVALNLNSPAGALRQLATDQDPWIRKAVACHLNTPVNLLIQLAEDPDARRAVASNPNTPVSFLEELAQDKSFRVSESLAQNPSTPVRILEELEKHPNDSVQGYAGYNLGHRHNGDLLTVYRQGLSHLRSLVSELPMCLGIPYEMCRALASRHVDDIREIPASIVPHLYQPVSDLEKQAHDPAAWIRKRVASQPNTPVSLLEYFADDKSQSNYVKSKVAANPNTPGKTLQQLASVPYLRTAVAENPNTPGNVLEELAGDPVRSVRQAVARNLNTPSETLEQMANGNHVSMRDVALNPNTSVNVLERLAEDQDWVIVRNIASNPSTPPSLLEKLAGDERRQVQKAVFHSLKRVPENSDILGRILQKLAETKDHSLIWKVATHPNTPESVLEELAKGTERRYVACNPNIPLRLLEQLAQDTDSSIRQSAINNLCQNVVQNPDIPGSILKQLAEIKDSKLGVAIALHSNTHESTLLQLLKHQDEKVRTVVAKNPNTPMKVLERLLEDKYRYVREAAIANLSQNFNARESILNQWLAVQNPETPEYAIAQMITSEWLIIREYTALHPNASTIVLEQLALDKSSAVRSNVAQNLNTSSKVLEQLAEDKDKEVAIAVAQNPNTPVSILEQFAQQGKQNSPIKQAAVKNLFSQYPDRVVSFLEEYIKSSQPSFTRLLVFLHPLAPSPFLAKNFRSSSWLERYAIAQNPNTPAAIRQRLAQDGNRIVRAAATNQK